MSALTVNTRITPTDLGLHVLPGAWMVWSKAPDGPGCYFLVPYGEHARTIPSPATDAPLVREATKYAVVRAVMGASSVNPRLELVRTDPARPDLERADLDRRNAEKQRSHA